MEKLAQTHTATSLLKFALPSVLMMLFLSAYTMVDGLFVSQFVGTTALSALNMTMPLMGLFMALAIMPAAGGSAIIASALGAGDRNRACRTLSLIVLTEAIVGVSFSVAGNVFLVPIVTALGANADQMPYCIEYLRIYLAAVPFLMLQSCFQTFLTTAGRPGLGLAAVTCAGLANVALDYVFMGLLGSGIGGAAWATGIGYAIPSLCGLIFFAKRSRPLHFARPRFELRTLAHACGNGASEMVANLAESVTTFLFNMQALALFGTDGVAAITVLLYFEFLFTSVFYGYSAGIAPVISYNNGARNIAQLKHVVESGLKTIAALCAASFTLVHLLGPTLISLFVGNSPAVCDIANRGLPIYSCAFLLMGFTFFVSDTFTALGDGKTSALIAFSRSFLFLGATLLVLPRLFGEMGLWCALPVAELAGALVAGACFLRNRRRIGFVGKAPVATRKEAA